MVIDPGPDDPEHLAAVVAALGGSRPAAILLTHGHLDHSALAVRLAEQVGGPVGTARGACAEYVDPRRVDRWLADGDRVETDAGPIIALATPGHAPEHLAFVHEAEEIRVFVGDLLMGTGNTTLVAPPEGELHAYLASLRRVDDLRADVLHPAHGTALTDPGAAVRRYVAHREARIRQVAAAAASIGDADPARISALVYGTGVPPELAAAAEGSVRAVLDFLVTVGRARRTAEGSLVMVERE